MEEAKRFRRARATATLASIQATAEEMLGLPAGCIEFVDPTGRKVRSDAQVKTLRKYWGD